MTICEVTALLRSPLPSEKLEELATLLFDEISHSIKGGYRSEEENREVATTDAKMFLTAYFLNEQKQGTVNDILGGTHYLITSTFRTLRNAQKLGLKVNVIAKPNSIINLLDKIGQFSPTSSEIVNLFDNPYLVEAVNNSWDDIKALAEAGVSLQGKNVVRLRWDLDREIKDFISIQNNMDENDAASETEKVEGYISFIRNIKSKGYKLIPDVDLLEIKVSELESEVKINNKKHDALQSEIQKFGKRRQQYLDRIKNNNGKKKK